jgi:hypothetical protein
VAALALLPNCSTPLISEFASALDEAPIVAFALPLPPLCVDGAVEATDGAADKRC